MELKEVTKNQKLNIEQVTWEQFEKGCQLISNHVRKSKRKLKNIYGIPRGGIVVAVRLSHLLSLPLILDESLINSNTLVVDDISDSGKTLKKYENYFIVTLYYHRQSVTVPNYWVWEKKNNRWVEFPWEVPYVRS